MPGQHPTSLGHSFVENVSQLSELATNRLSLTAHSLAIELANADVRYLQTLEALANIFSHHASSRVVVASVLQHGSLKIFFCCENPPSVQARAAIANIPTVLTSPHWTYDEKLKILCLGMDQKRGSARRIVDSFEMYRKRVGPEVRLQLREVVAAEPRDGLGEHAELALAEYLFQRGASRVDLGTPKKNGVCFTCEAWFKEVMSACPELGVRCWTHSGECKKTGELPNWTMRRAGRVKVEDTCLQDMLIQKVQVTVEEYIHHVRCSLDLEDTSDDEDSEDYASDGEEDDKPNSAPG